MANSQKKNVIYIDELGAVTVSALKPICRAIMITPLAEDSRVTIKESQNGTVVIDVLIKFTESRYIDFGDLDGIELSSTFEISALDNIASVIMYGSWDQPVNRARGR